MSAKRTSRGIEPKWFTVFIFFLVGAAFGALVSYLYTQATLPSWIKQRLAINTYQYVNPTFTAQTAQQYGNFDATSKDLDQKISALIASAKNQSTVSQASVYYRDLGAGGWVDAAADTQFSAGTILKVPLMIAYYKLAEQDPNILNDTVHFDGHFVPQNDVFTQHSDLTSGQTYTVSDLIQRMIDNSDETAATLLYNHIDVGTLSEIYSDLGVDFTKSASGQYAISLRRYGSFFRQLYSAGYLSPASSEQALGLLAQNKSDSLLSQEIPRSVPLAYRVGGKAVGVGGTQYQVYECDIVYDSKHDYLLCALGTASSLSDLRSLFAGVGAAVYSAVGSG